MSKTLTSNEGDNQFSKCHPTLEYFSFEFYQFRTRISNYLLIPRQLPEIGCPTRPVSLKPGNTSS